MTTAALPPLTCLPMLNATLAVHLPPALAVPLGVLAVVPLAWYWRRLGRPDVPRSRRRIRRLSLVIMLALVVLFVLGLSLVDPVVRSAAYVVVWSLGILAVCLVMLVAVLDALNNLRLHRELQREAYMEAAAGLIEAARIGRNGELGHTETAAPDAGGRGVERRGAAGSSGEREP